MATTTPKEAIPETTGDTPDRDQSKISRPGEPGRYALALDFAAQQVRRLIETYPDVFPMYTVGGKWLHGGEAWTNWCEGFLGGQL